MKVIEPQRNNSTATSITRSQTFIFTATEMKGTHEQATLTAVARTSMGTATKELDNEAGAVTNNQGVKT